MGLTATLLCVALTVYHEARGEQVSGQLAVANVIHNRAGGDPKKYCTVVHAPGQFSWNGKGWKVDQKSEAWRSSVQVALSFRHFPDVSNGATYFHERRARPLWRKRFVLLARIGSHYFYKGS